jgi:outer membrane protein assembly factor BamB
MTCWNSSNIPDLYGSALGPEPRVEGGDPNYSWYSWRPYGKTVDAVGPIDPSVSSTLPLGLQGYMWNKSIPVISDGIVQKIVGDVILGSNYHWIGPFYWNGGHEHWAISLKQGQEGTLMFKEPVQVSGNRSIAIRAASAEDDVFVIAEKETRTWTGYSLTTGNKLWGPTESQPVLDWVGFGETWWPDVIADGKLFSGSFSGVLSCYNVKTGELLWNYTATDPFSETLMGPAWCVGVQFIADGKIYIQNYEHGTFMPIPRGSPTICVNATNGEELWRIPIRSIREALIVGADGVMVTFNGYDCNDYAIGRGPSALTAQAPLSGVTVGSYASITGTMMDVSPGTEDAALRLRFPNGVPAIADEYMSEWMEYVYMQFPRPVDAVGVPVKIQIVDPAGTYAWIGTTTSDAYGNYVYSFIPQMEGQYTVIATFDGSDSFYGATTTTYLQVGPAVTPSGSIIPGPTAQFPMTEAVFIGAIIAIAAVIAAVFLIKRK